MDVDALGAQEYCYLTTTGRVSGRPHTIEIWFVAHEGCAYLMAGSAGSDWVRNLRADPAAGLRIGTAEAPVTGRVVDDRADARQPVIRARMADKYGEREADGSLSRWAETAIVVEVCLRDAPIA
jgi:deazaflavin-dependent oxidoreductase (nitroreductase family)